MLYCPYRAILLDAHSPPEGQSKWPVVRVDLSS